MRRFCLFLALSSLLVLGACSSSEALTGLDEGSTTLPTLQDGGVEGGSNNGQCTPPNCP